MREIKIEIVDERVAQIVAQKSEQERLKIGFEMWNSASIMLRGCIKSLHPDWSDKEISSEVARRFRATT